MMRLDEYDDDGGADDDFPATPKNRGGNDRAMALLKAQSERTEVLLTLHEMTSARGCIEGPCLPLISADMAEYAGLPNLQVVRALHSLSTKGLAAKHPHKEIRLVSKGRKAVYKSHYTITEKGRAKAIAKTPVSLSQGSAESKALQRRVAVMQKKLDLSLMVASLFVKREPTKKEFV